ncbi:MAG: TAXI family TRAP transporter solute-binding subunit [Chloroflexota bacterium]
MKNRTMLAKSLFLVVALSLLLMAACGAPAGPSEQAPTTIRLLGGAVGGEYYIFATGLAPIIQKYSTLKATSAAGYMSQDNIRMLRTGEADTAFATNDALRDAWNGTGVFKDKLRWLRLVDTGAPGVANFVARADSNIKTPGDLAGKKWIADLPTSPPVTAVKNAILEFYNLKDKVDILPFTTHGAYLEAMKEKRVDAVIAPGTPPTAGIINLTSEVNCVMVDVEKDKAQAINRKYLDTLPITIPAGTYKGQTKDVINLGWRNALITRAELPESLVYEMTKAIYEHPADVKAIHPAAISFTKEHIFEDAILPYHPGAVKYFKEAKVWTDKMEAFQQKMLAEAK